MDGNLAMTNQFENNEPMNITTEQLRALISDNLKDNNHKEHILEQFEFMKNGMDFFETELRRYYGKTDELKLTISKLNEIIGNSEAIYQEKCKAFEFEATERRADIEDLEKENKSLENQLEERNVSIQAVEQLRDWININKRVDIKGGYYEIFNPNKVGLCPFEYAFYRNYNGVWILESGEQVHPSYYIELPNNPSL